MAFGVTPVDGSATPIPMSSVVPDGTSTPVAVEGGPSLVSGGNTLAPVSLYVKDGNDVTLGLTTQTKATDGSVTSWSVIQLLKGVFNALLGTIAVSVVAGTNAIGGITGAGANYQIKDDTQYGDAVINGVFTVHSRLYNGTSYDRWRGDVTNGAWVHVKTSDADGTSTTAVAAAVAANTVIKASGGRLARILVTATGTVTMLLYDNATTPSGTVIGVVKSSAVVGDIIELRVPAANGITIGGSASNAGVTVVWS